MGRAPGACLPVERAGEDAVINAAARALAGARTPWTSSFYSISSSGASFQASSKVRLPSSGPRPYRCSLRLLRKTTAGPLPKRRCGGLAGPPSRPSFGALLLHRPIFESETRHRQRRSALRLLVEMGVSPGAWDIVRRLINDPDFRIATLACKLGLICDHAANKRHSVERLVRLLEDADGCKRIKIELFDSTFWRSSASIQLLQQQNSSMKERAKLALVRAKARAAAEDGGDGND